MTTASPSAGAHVGPEAACRTERQLDWPFPEAWWLRLWHSSLAGHVGRQAYEPQGPGRAVRWRLTGVSPAASAAGPGFLVNCHPRWGSQPLDVEDAIARHLA